MPTTVTIDINMDSDRTIHHELGGAEAPTLSLHMAAGIST